MGPAHPFRGEVALALEKLEEAAGVVNHRLQQEEQQRRLLNVYTLLEGSKCQLVGLEAFLPSTHSCLQATRPI